MNPGVYNFPTHKARTTFDGVEFTMLNDANAPIDITGCSILMQLFYNNANGNKAKEYDNGEIGGLTIVNGTDGIFRFDEQLVDLRPGLYWLEIEFTFSNGRVKQYIEGTWSITANGK